ncbi:MAG: HAD family hydrolase [Candidatus Thorarchaeota archaeon]
MSQKKPLKAIIWDLDGTIIHFKINSTKARKVAINIFKSHGIEKKNLSIKRSILDNIIASKEIFEKRGYTSNQINQILKKVDEEVSNIEYEAALKATKIPGIEQVLIFVAENNLKQAIFTFNKNKHARISLENVGLLKYFDVIVGRDDVQNPKPHPEHILDICDKLNVKPNEIVIIGDNYRDIEGAINVGAHSIALHTRLAKEETLQKADIIIKECELPQRLIAEIKKLL